MGNVSHVSHAGLRGQLRHDPVWRQIHLCRGPGRDTNHAPLGLLGRSSVELKGIGPDLSHNLGRGQPVAPTEGVSTV
jgi:hypothetical protein